MSSLLRGIVRIIRRRLANAQLKARFLAILAFAIFAYLGANDATDIARSLSTPATMAQTLGITAQESTTRSIVLLVLSAIITLGSLGAMVGALQRTTLLRGWIIVTAAYLLDALYHLIFAIVQLRMSQLQALIPGLIYMLLAAAAYSFGRQASRALDPVVH